MRLILLDFINKVKVNMKRTLFTMYEKYIVTSWKVFIISFSVSSVTA